MLKVVIAPDAPVVEEGVASMLSRTAPDLDVIRLVDTSDDPGPVDILLYDPHRHSAADLANLRRFFPDALVVAFCWSASADVVDEARRGGAAGFLSKDLDADEVVAGLRALRAGRRDAFVVLPGGRSAASPAAERPHGLTERELEVLRLITHGYSNDEIARRLFLSINSVKSYIRTGYRKIGAARRTQAVLWGVEQGFAPVSETRV